MSVDDRLRNTGRDHLLLRYRLQGPCPLPFGEQGSCVRFHSHRNRRASGERLLRVGEVVQRGADLRGGYSCRRPPGPQCCPPRSVSATARPQDPMRRQNDSARPSFVLTLRSNGRRSLHYLRRVDWDDIRDDGLGAARSTRYTRLVIEPGVSKTSSPSGSRTVARVISPRGVD